MTIRVRPTDLVIPQDDPFQNDLLDRKPSIEALTDLLGALEGPCVLALDSQWGGGKTTFLKMWAVHLRREGFAVAEFNAWETDFSGDPFVALSAKLQEQLDDAEADDAGQLGERFRVAAKKIALRALPIAIRLLSQGLLESGSLEQAVAEEVTSYANDRLDEFSEVEQSFVEFKESLQEGATRLCEQRKNRPLFIMIDELDRCRPSYAIELLEVAKHLFSVDRIVFVLAINRSELAHSVKALYGSDFDARGYLHRFFDVDYELQKPDRLQFVRQAIDDIGLLEFYQYFARPLHFVRELVENLLSKSELDLRRTAQTVRRLMLVCTPTSDPSQAASTAATILLVLRALLPDTYAKFVRGAINDKEVIDEIYQHGSLKDVQYTEEGYLLEAIICFAWIELENIDSTQRISLGASLIFKEYGATLEQAERQFEAARRTDKFYRPSHEEDAHIRRAEGVRSVCTQLQHVAGSLNYLTAMRRVELLPVK